MSNENRPINPLRIAEKMQLVQNFENEPLLHDFIETPRMVEVLWALQYFSRPARPKPGRDGMFVGGYPGGLRSFTRDFLADSHDMLGTRSMREFGDVRYDRAKASAVYNEVPRGARNLPGEQWMFEAALTDRDKVEVWGDLLDRPPRPELGKKGIADVVSRASRAAFLKLCMEAAQAAPLADYFRALCEMPHARFHRSEKAAAARDVQAPWFFSDVATALLRFIDRHKERLQADIAETEVTREVFKWLGRAHATRRGVLISGNSRFGKTEAVLTWCEMNPGKARIVQTPPSNSESDLLRAVAKALGMEIGPKQRGYQLREEIGYLVEQAGLMLVFDEAQAIFPVSFGRNTPPARLNWIRRSVLDCGVPAVFVCTPQSYQGARSKFLKATNFAIEQWDERLLKTVNLPAEVSHGDLVAIARIHFPNLGADYLEYVVRAATLTERNYVSDISRIADLASLNAAEAGRERTTFADIKAAIADVLPAAAVSDSPRKEPRSAERVHQPFMDAETALHACEAPRPVPARRVNFERVEQSEPALSTAG